MTNSINAQPAPVIVAASSTGMLHLANVFGSGRTQRVTAMCATGGNIRTTYLRFPRELHATDTDLCRRCFPSS